MIANIWKGQLIAEMIQSKVYDSGSKREWSKREVADITNSIR